MEERKEKLITKVLLIIIVIIMLISGYIGWKIEPESKIVYRFVTIITSTGLLWAWLMGKINSD